MSRKTAQKCTEGNRDTSVPSDANASSKTRYRAFCFTDFNEKEPEFIDGINYLCYSPEICPHTQRHHFQGYFYLKNPKTISAASKIFPDKIVWVQAARGTPKENRTYCGADSYQKDGKIKERNPLFVEHGDLPSQGARSDLNEIKDRIMNGTRVEEITMENPIMYHQYGRTLEKIEDICLRKKYRTEMTKGYWYFGDTGTGKSHAAFADFTPETHYVYETTDKGWWDGYKGQETVIINDFRGQIPYEELLSLIDKWPKFVPRRGREPMPFLSKCVIITSPLTPEEVYHRRNDRDNINQLLRRLEVIHLHRQV